MSETTDANGNEKIVATQGPAGASPWPVSVSSLPLPSGATTEATLLNVLTTSDFDTKVGSLTETAPTTDTASSGLNGRLQRIAQRITSLIALLPAALTGSGNLKVSLQESTASQAVTNAGTFVVQAAQSGTWTVTGAGGTFPVTGTFWQATQPISVSALPLPSGAATEATLGSILTTSDFDTKTGSLTETAPTTDTASSGLNGRLQRIAQRITSLIGLLPAALTGSGNLKVSLQESTASQAVTGTFWQATQPVSGTVTATIAAGAATIAKAEDVASVDADVGVPAMAVRKATPANTSGADGDYEFLQMSAGRLWVDGSGVTLTVASHAVTNAGTFLVQAAQSGTWTVTGAGGTFPVTGTFWQATQPISAAALPLPSGAATETTLGSVLTISDFDTKTGSLTETAPTTDTASSGLNGRLQRIAQRITSLIGLLPAALTGSGNLKVSLQESTASQAVTGTFWQATQPVSGTVTATIAAGAATIAKAEDVGSADADVGVPAMAVRKATPANTSGTDGDYEFLQMAAGRLWVDASGVTLTVASHAVTNAGTFAVQEADGANITLGAKADAKSTATDTTAVTAMSVLKQISASVQAPPSQAVTGTFWQATQPVSIAATVTVDTELAAAVALGDAVSNPTVPLVGACQMLWDGTQEHRMYSNTPITLLSSAVRAVTTTSSNQRNRNGKGVWLVLNVTVAGSGTLSVFVGGIDPVTTGGVTLNAATVTVTTTGRYVVQVYGGLANTVPGGNSGILESVNAILPETWYVTITHSGGTNWTYSLGAVVML